MEWEENEAMPIKECDCPGPMEQKRWAITNAILVYTCPHCGGGIAAIADYIHGIERRIVEMKADLYQQLGNVLPPGKAVLTACDDCQGQGCAYCGETGQRLWKACPKCGDIGFDFINGRNETDGMVCQIACGFTWAADDPRWLAQRLPVTIQAA